MGEPDLMQGAHAIRVAVEDIEVRLGLRRDGHDGSGGYAMSAMGGNALMLFAMDSSRAFAEQVAAQLGIKLSPHEERQFEDGEHKERTLASVRGRDVFVLQSLYADPAQSVDDKLCRLLFFIGALKDAAASRVTAIVPYLAYARKDQKSQARDPVTSRYVAALFEAVGTDVVVTLDVHNLAAFQNAFRCGTEHLEARPLFVGHFAALLGARDVVDVVVVSPDAGGIKRSEKFRHGLMRVLGRQVDTAFAEKFRSGDVLTGERIVGGVKGKVAIIIDDLISSGSTLARTAIACHDLGASRIFGAATHGLFTGDAPALLADSPMEQIVVTDAVPAFRLEHSGASDKVTILSCTGLLARAIQRLHDGGSITELTAS
jgi:ribose-phosphate pyrophosphokinase